jgi:hypothetical protein
MKLSKVAVAATVFAIGSISYAQVVSYTSFIGGSGYDQIAQGMAIIGPANPQHIVMGYQFTAGVGGSLSSIRIPTLYGSGSTLLSLGLFTNQAGDLLGNQLEGWQFDDSGGQHITTLVNNDPQVTLNAGTKYWLVMAATGDGVHFWGKSQIGGLMFQLFSNDGFQTTHYGNNDIFPAYEVNVNPVPEPLGALALGLGAIVMISRRRR